MNNSLPAKKFKKSFILFVVLLLFVGIVVCGIYAFVSDNSLGKFTTIDQYKINGVSGDMFKISVYHSDFPKSLYDYVIYDNNKNLIFSYRSREKGYGRINIENIYEDSSLRAYFVSVDAILYFDKAKKQFNNIYLDQLGDTDIQQISILKNCGIKLVSDRRWKWVKAFGEFLVKTKDEYTIKLMQRYSKGDFSDDDINMNIESEYTKEDIQNFCKEILTKHNI